MGWPVGKRSFVDHTPDNGFDSPDQKAQDIYKLLKDGFTASISKDLYEAVRAFALGDRFHKFEPGATQAQDEEFELVGEVIRNRMRSWGRFYMTFLEPSKDVDRSELGKLMLKLSKKLPGMLFFVLSNDHSIKKREIAQFGLFVEMIVNYADGGRS